MAEEKSGVGGYEMPASWDEASDEFKARVLQGMSRPESADAPCEHVMTSEALARHVYCPTCDKKWLGSAINAARRAEEPPGFKWGMGQHG